VLLMEHLQLQHRPSHIPSTLRNTLACSGIWQERCNHVPHVKQLLLSIRLLLQAPVDQLVQGHAALL
jgi:hypothetical protein